MRLPFGCLDCIAAKRTCEEFVYLYNPNKGQRDVKNVVVLGGKYQKSKTPEVVVLVPLTIFVFINNKKI